MEYTTQEIIARLMTMTLALEADGKWQEASVISQAVALIMVQTNSVERLRHSSQADYTDIRQVAQFISEQKYD